MKQGRRAQKFILHHFASSMDICHLKNAVLEAAANIMDIISRLPGCDGQASDAVSAYTQVKMEDAHKLLKIPKSECPCTVIQDCYGKGNLRRSY